MALGGFVPLGCGGPPRANFNEFPFSVCETEFGRAAGSISHEEEFVMKLSPAQVERTVSQLQIQAIPDNHPLVPQLNRLFGDHTYFLDQNGLSIVEPAEDEIGVAPTADASRMGVVVSVANWTDANPPKLKAHEPQPTESLVALETDGG
jgi:hypothetical protein